MIIERKEGLRWLLVVAIIAGASFAAAAHAQSIGVTLPSVPTGVNATVVPPSQVSLSWTASTESSGTIEDYYVYRNGVQISLTPGTSIVDAELLPGVYSYTVAAYDATGNLSAQSAAVSVSLVADTTPPTAPTGVTITGTTSTNSSYAQVPLTISWIPSTDNVGVAGYYVYRNGIQIVTSTSAFTGTSITDTVPPGNYTYSVVAYDAAQNFSSHSVPVTVTVSVDTTPPSVPTDVSAEQVSATGVNVSWAPSTDSGGVAGYQIYRNYLQIASATGSPYADSGLSAGTQYVYTVAAYDVAGNVSEPSAPAEVTVQTANGPDTPYGLSASLMGTSTAKISWAPAIDALPITDYTVYRDGTQIASVTSTNYEDVGLASGTYEYVVSVTDISGAVSATSSPASILIPVLSATPVPVAATTTPPAVIASAPVVSQSATSSVSTAAATPEFTESLYFGLRNAQVNDLQSLLSGYSYLASTSVTGFFGNLTLRAVQNFQCDKDIVCTGGAGWGMVGPKTRNVLNGLEGSTTENLSTQIQALQAELAALEEELSAGNQ